MLDRARGQWFATHLLPLEGKLRALLRPLADSDADIDDLLQETYAKVVSMPDYQSIEHPRAFILTVARNLAVERLRRKRIVSIEAMADLEALHVFQAEPSPEEIVGARQELRLVAAAIEALPPQCREVFRLRKIQGLSQREVAERLGLSESSVEKHVARALRLCSATLAGVMERDGSGGALRGALSGMRSVMTGKRRHKDRNSVES
jgi:RNA polymerase sigma-70 factor (ECF subfamily)